MSEPQLEIEKRLDRIEKAIRLLAEKTMYTEDQAELTKILWRENDSEQGSEHHPAAEQQAEPGPEVSGSRDQ